tara:strand:+ start:4668 stop:5651 length:984 start_codon:yes stop_codon:yes gene_type:complete
MKKIIAEIGSTHDGSFGNAIKMIESVKNCGADMVKFQLHLPDYETLPDAPNPEYFKDENRYDYFKRTQFSQEQLYNLKQYCESLGLDFVVSPFSEKALEILEKIDTRFYKVASGEVTNTRLLESIKKTGKIVFLSSGMSSWNQLENAVNILGKDKLVVLQCTSIYPCPPERVGINIIQELVSKFKLEVGYSDHTLCSTSAILAVACGAKLIEKHFTLSNLMYGSDAKYAMEPNLFKDYCKSVKKAWELIEMKVDKNYLKDLEVTKKVFEKSIVTSRELNKGEILSINDIDFKKPGSGISASKYKNILGKKVKKKILANTLISEKDLD